MPRLTNALQLQDGAEDSEKTQPEETKIEKIDKEEQQVLPDEENGKIAEN